MSGTNGINGSASDSLFSTTQPGGSRRRSSSMAVGASSISSTPPTNNFSADFMTPLGSSPPVHIPAHGSSPFGQVGRQPSPHQRRHRTMSTSSVNSVSEMDTAMARMQVHHNRNPRTLSVSPGTNGGIILVSTSGGSSSAPPLVQNHPEHLARVAKLRSQGSVLSRGTLLKRDHFNQGLNDNIDMYLEGAPNFRMSDLNVFGVSQPTITGLSTILKLLNCHPQGTSSALWFNTREEPVVYIRGEPYVLRDAEHPKQNLRIFSGINAERLEQMESRLKDDIFNEARKCNGLILVHDELENETIVPAWIAAEHVQTTQEIFERFREKGYRINYTRIPISPEQRPEDKYLDVYLNIVRNTSIDTALIFNCGMGVGRTTFGMVAALLIRRAQLVANGQPDPYARFTQDPVNIAADVIDAESEKMAILRLVYVLERGLNSKMSPHSAIEWALARSSMIDNLKNAILGNYNIILSLASVLEDGARDKRLLDRLINRCDALVNLREEILMNRVRFTLENDPIYLEKALGSLERYFFLLSFCAYVNEVIPTQSTLSFNRWIMERGEVWNMLESLRKGVNLFLFRPVEDLSAFAVNKSHLPYQEGNELGQVVIRNRNGAVLVPQTILKVDHWSAELVTRSLIEGAPNFRHIRATNVFAVAQPTLAGMKNMFAAVKAALTGQSVSTYVWINLREEPLVYINGAPYVLRDEYYTLRNIKAYSGITDSRLELLENRLKDDVVKELGTYEGKILLHEETAEGVVEAVWTAVQNEHVLTLRDTVGLLKETMGLAEDTLEYYRVPVTAEVEPEPMDFDQLVQIVGKYNFQNTAFLLNCQIGMSRSTTGTVIVLLILSWLAGPHHDPIATEYMEPKVHYQSIHSLLRVIRNGLECKHQVDRVIDHCATHINLRDAIENYRVQAENEVNPEKRKALLRKGVRALKRYFMLIAFQSYLEQSNPECLDDRESFMVWLRRYKEFVTIMDELEHQGEQSLLPVGELQPGEGVALTSEVSTVVNRRRGSVLAQQMILKYDHFPGCQKLSLPERLEGAPNFRCVDFQDMRGSISSMIALFEQHPVKRDSRIFGVAMPTREAIRTVLKRIGSGKKLLWTSLREEPVLYVNGKPYVLRTSQDPIKNLETTGIERDRVEHMEHRMKMDVLKEVQQYNGRFLLHEEEVLAASGGFAIVPIWENVKEEDVQTPKEVFEAIQAEGYDVEYLRIPITDEQAPIPSVFDLLLSQVSKLDDQTDILFNCQMGRGRTTTGMVVACVQEFVRQYGSEIDTIITDRAPFGGVGMGDENPDENDRERYLRGEYKIILQLISVLQHGKLSKLLVDRAIDTCKHIQDIRGAIYDFKLRLQPLEVGSKKYEAMFRVGVNYLVRYFYLITFANYLLERSHAEQRNRADLFPSFGEWLGDRREIVNIVQNQDLV